MWATLISAIFDSAILHKTTSLIHSDSTWWLQPSWTLPCWIQTLPSWIQTPCYLLSDSLKNTLTPLWLWLKLIQSIRRLFSPKQNNFWLCGQALKNIFWYTFKVYNIIVSNISSDMNKPCWKLVKACPQSQKLFCFGENNLLILIQTGWETYIIIIQSN